jgi:Methyltransferase FkbM domain
VPLQGTGSMAVPMRTLDSEVKQLGLIPTIIKIDVEGWELEVLKGTEDVLTRYSPKLFLSLHPEALAKLQTSIEAVQSWLEERGYCSRIIATDHEVHVVATTSVETTHYNLG